MMDFDRTHDLSLSAYTFLPFGINASMTYLFQSGVPYTQILERGGKAYVDEIKLFKVDTCTYRKEG